MTELIKAIANQKIDLSQEEYDYYLELEKHFGKDSFLNLFKTNKNGRIISVLPSQNSQTAMILIFFFLNVMLNQRLREMDAWVYKVEKLESKINSLEKKLK